MNSSSPTTRNLTLVLSTIAAIAFAFVGYYYFYVQNQGNSLDERNQRVLTQIRNNVIRKNKTYVQNAVNNSPKDIGQLKKRVWELVNEDIRKQNQATRERFPEFFPVNTNGKITASGIRNSVAILKVDPALRKQKADSIRNTFTPTFTPGCKVTVSAEGKVFTVEQVKNGSEQMATLSFEEWEDRSNRLTQLKYLITPDTFHPTPIIEMRQVLDTMAAYPPWRVNYNVWVKDPTTYLDDSGFRISMSVGLRQFLLPLEREDIFDGMLLIRDKETSDEVIRDLIYSSLDDPRIVNYLVSESDRLRQYSSKDSTRLGPLEDLPYKIYSSEMVFQGNKLMLVGLVEQNRFDREKLGISTVAIITMSVLAILVLLAFPLMKLVLMGNYERLSLNDLLLAVISAILGTFIISQLIIDGYGYNGPDRKRRSQQLVELSDQVVDSLTEELNLIRTQLVTADNQASGPLHLDDKTSIWRDSSYSSHLWTYPYFQSIYWANRDFQLVNEWTANIELAPKISLASRSYLTGLAEGKAWKLPGDGDNFPEFRMESLLAKTTGEQLAVVSIASSGSARGNSKTTSSIFLTTQLRSLHNPVLPPGFGFAIIDKTGSVWFHSDATRNLQENFLEETDEPSLVAALTNRAPLKISGSYLGKDHEFFLKPLAGMPLYLVAFRETNVYRSTHAQLLSMTFFLIVAAFLAGLGFILVQILVNPRSPLLKNDQFTFDWLRPDKHKKKSYRQLILVNLVNLIIGMVLSPWFSHGLPVLCMIGLLYTYTFILAFLKLNRNAHKEFLWEEHRRIVFTTGALLLVSNIVFLALMGKREYSLLFLFQIIPVMFLIREIGSILLPNMKTLKGAFRGYTPIAEKISNWRQIFYWAIGVLDKPINRMGKGIEMALGLVLPKDLYHFFHSQMSYRLFLLSWLIILSVFPVIRFYEFSYNQESKRLIKFGQIQLLDEYEIHTSEDLTWWQRYPETAIDDKVAIPFSSRPLAQSGVYSQPFFNTQIIPGSDLVMEEHLVAFSRLSRSGYKEKPLHSVKRDFERKLPAYEVFDSVLSIIRPYYTEQARLTHRLPSNHGNSDQLNWDEYNIFPQGEMGGISKTNHLVKRVLKMSKEGNGSIYSDLPYYKIPLFRLANSGSRVIFWVGFLSFILLIYYLVKFVIRKFFAMDFVEQVDPDPLAMTEAISTLNRHLFLTIPPRSMVRDYLGLLENRKDLMPFMAAHSRKEYVFDLRQTTDWTRLNGFVSEPTEGEETVTSNTPLSPVLILDHLEFRATKESDCTLLLGLIGKLMELGPTIILICTHTPVILQEKMTDAILGLKKDDSTQVRDQIEASCSKVLGEFTRIDYPIPFWTQVIYDGAEPSNGDPFAIFSHKKVLLDGMIAVARFVFLAPSVLKHESKRHIEATVRERKTGIEGKNTLFDKIGFECSELPNHEYVLGWKSASEDSFLLDDHTTASQVRAIITKLEANQAAAADGEAQQPIHIFSTLAPQELVQLLIRDDRIHDEYIQKWDRLIHRFELVEFVREFRHIESDERVAEIIREECMHDPFLQGLQSYLRKHLVWLEARLASRLDRGNKAGDRRLRESVIVEIEQQAHLYYQALWNSCSEEEQYLIYDLAQDGLVNTHNRSGINNLVRMGIIHRGFDNLELMNHSFRNFVLTVVNEKEALMMELKIKREGTWNRIRVPITLILLAFGIFIFYFQADWFDQSLGLLTALAAFIPAFNSVFERIASLKIPGMNIFAGMFKKK